MKTVRQIVISKLQVGDIIHPRGVSLFPARSIQKCLRSWGNHDALVIRCNNEMYAGDAEPLFAKLNSVEDKYNAWLRNGRLEDCRVYRIKDLTDIQAARAAHWWVMNAQGKPYDFLSYFRLLGKCIVGDLFHGEAGWRWANWCTESVMKAFRDGAFVNPWATKNPTPKTTENRVSSGLIIDVTDERTEMLEINNDGTLILQPAT